MKLNGIFDADLCVWRFIIDVSIHISFFYFACITTLRFTETLIMHHLTLPQEPDRVAYFRVFYEPEDILIGSSGFLFGRHIFMQIRDRIALGLEVGGGPGGAPCGLGPECKGVVHIVFVESGFFQLLRRQVSGQLVNDCADDLHMCQFVIP